MQNKGWKFEINSLELLIVSTHTDSLKHNIKKLTAFSKFLQFEKKLTAFANNYKIC